MFLNRRLRTKSVKVKCKWNSTVDVNKSIKVIEFDFLNWKVAHQQHREGCDMYLRVIIENLLLFVRDRGSITEVEIILRNDIAVFP